MIRLIRFLLVFYLCAQTVKNWVLPSYSPRQDYGIHPDLYHFLPYFPCENGRTVSPEYRCDGENDCGDNSDESKCPGSVHEQKVSNECIPNKTFKCSVIEDFCIPHSNLCDHRRDCPEGDDEGDQCRKVPCYELNCAHSCVTNGTQHNCTCRDGFKLIDSSNCEDINECDNHVCSQECRNTKGSFECTCVEGYELVNKTKCWAKDISPILYYSIGREIRAFDLRLNISYTVVYSRHRDWEEISAIERFENRLFYVGTTKDNHTHSALNQVILNGNRQFKHETKLPFSDKYGRIRDIAIDWIHGNLYLCTRNKIIVCRIEPFYCTPIKNKLKSVHSILVQPERNRLIWSQDASDGVVGIFSIDLNQILDNARQIIENHSPLQWPLDIVFDGAMERLYWIDKLNYSIQYVEISKLYVNPFGPSYSAPSYSAPSYSAPTYSAPSYSAPSYSAPSYSAPSYSAPNSNPMIHHVLNNTELAPISLAVFEDSIYWISSTNNSIFVSNKHNGSNTSVFIPRHMSGQFSTISLYHPLNHPNASSSYSDFCLESVCSHICLSSSTEPHYVCYCPEHTYKQNSTTCALKSDSSSFVVSFGNQIGRFYVDSEYAYPIIGSNRYMIDEIAFNFDREELYAHDRYSNQIGVVQLGNLLDSEIHWSPLVQSRIREVVSLVYDVNTDYLYWVDRKKGTFEVTTIRGQIHRAILHDHLEAPLSLALNARERKWFIGLEGESTGKRQIISLNMNGKNRITIVESNTGMPMEIAINPVTSELFWGDPELGQIKYMFTSNVGTSSTPNALADNRVDKINSLAIFNDSICWTNIDSLNVHCNHYTLGAGHSTIPFLRMSFFENALPNVSLTRVASADQQPALYDYCLGDHHRCDHLCLIGTQTYTCACSDGFVLLSNKHSCSAKRDWVRIEDSKQENEQKESFGKDELMERMLRQEGNNNKQNGTWTVVKVIETKVHHEYHNMWISVIVQTGAVSLVIIFLFVIHKITKRYYSSITRYFQWKQEHEIALNQPIPLNDNDDRPDGIHNLSFEYAVSYHHDVLDENINNSTNHIIADVRQC